MPITSHTVVGQRVQDLLARCRRDVDEGLLPSCQVALAQGGEVIVDETFGDAAPDTRYVVFSATKPFVAGVVWQLIAEGVVDPAQRVVEYLPDFGTLGKEVVTVEQVMLHTSGFPNAPLGPSRWSTSASRRAAFGTWRLEFEPGPPTSTTPPRPTGCWPRSSPP